MDKLKISISFSKQYEDLYNQLKDVPNRSSFICEILKRNLDDSNYNANLEELVERAVIKALARNISVSEVSKDTRQSDISDEDRELINSLF